MERLYTDTDYSLIQVDTRVDGGADISGHAAVFYDGTPATEYRLSPGIVERIMPKAFSKTIKSDDVVGLFNHDPDNILGRKSAGTLKLKVDARGLHYQITPGNTSMANDVREHIRRGDLKGSSFGFKITREAWKEEGDTEVRQIEEVVLYDVGPVTFPAYEATDATARTQEAEESLARLRRSRRAEQVRLDLSQDGE